jgi:ABC-2 type transport system ATP-binding protein
VDGRVVRCHVRGPVAPLLTALAGANVTELLSREPSLEELFLAQYGEHGDQTPTAHQADKAEIADKAETQVARHDAG